MSTEGMVRSFQSVLMVDWDGRIEIGNGCKDVSVSYCFWNMSVQSNIINIDTKPSEKPTSLITNKTHLKDMTRLSSTHQTSSLESFHNVVIHFAPKSVAFSYQGMKSR